MRRAPKDQAFNWMVRNRLMGELIEERVVFIDHQNLIREAVYPSEYESGVLDQIRARLEKANALKAVVHVRAAAAGPPESHAPFTSVVEYLPDQEYYLLATPRSDSIWVSPTERPEAIENTKRLFGGGKEEAET